MSVLSKVVAKIVVIPSVHTTVRKYQIVAIDYDCVSYIVGNGLSESHVDFICSFLYKIGTNPSIDDAILTDALKNMTIFEVSRKLGELINVAKQKDQEKIQEIKNESNTIKG